MKKSVILYYRYAMGMGAPLMLGWSVLLLWADRKPLERNSLLPITLLVVLGEVANEISLLGLATSRL